MTNIDVRLKPEILEQFGLPDILFPMSLETFEATISGDGDWPFASMLFHLQQRSREGGANWMELEPAMDRLAQILSPDDPGPVLSATGEDWWVALGPVDLRSKIVTIQRGENLIAAISPTTNGELQVSTFRPLDAKSARYIINMAHKPDPEHGVCMRENNWEYALDCSAGNGNFYAFDRGEAYLSYWEHGVGLMADRSIDHHWFAMRHLAARAPSFSVAELGVNYTYSE